MPAPFSVSEPFEQSVMTTDPKQSQIDKFKEAAREIEPDDDTERLKQRLAKVVKHKPVERPE